MEEQNAFDASPTRCGNASRAKYPAQIGSGFRCGCRIHL